MSKKLVIEIITCSNCGKQHSTDNFELIPMIGGNGMEREVNQVYLYDTGKISVSCDCGYDTEVKRNRFYKYV